MKVLFQPLENLIIFTKPGIDNGYIAPVGFTFGDACVSLDGCPISILPPSGVMQVAAYESINAEVHARRGR